MSIYFIDASRSFRFAMADQNRRVSSLQALIGSLVLARTLRPYWTDQERVGVLLPPTVAAVVNVAAPLWQNHCELELHRLEIRLRGRGTSRRSANDRDEPPSSKSQTRGCRKDRRSSGGMSPRQSARTKLVCPAGPIRSMPHYRTSLRADDPAHSRQPGHDHL